MNADSQVLEVAPSIEASNPSLRPLSVGADGKTLLSDLDGYKVQYSFAGDAVLIAGNGYMSRTELKHHGRGSLLVWRKAEKVDGYEVLAKEFYGDQLGIVAEHLSEESARNLVAAVYAHLDGDEARDKAVDFSDEPRVLSSGTKSFREHLKDFSMLAVAATVIAFLVVSAGQAGRDFAVNVIRHWW